MFKYFFCVLIMLAYSNEQFCAGYCSPKADVQLLHNVLLFLQTQQNTFAYCELGKTEYVLRDGKFRTLLQCIQANKFSSLSGDLPLSFSYFQRDVLMDMAFVMVYSLP